MASPGELVHKVAEALGVPEPTVIVHDRNLVRAGLRTKGGRGRSAATMTATDAANLIVAVAGSSVVKETVGTVNDYANLPPQSGEVSMGESSDSIRHDRNALATWQLVGFPISRLQDLPERHTFRDALIALIEAATDGSLTAAITALPRKTVQGNLIPNLWSIEVTMWGPYPQAAIRIFCSGFSEMHRYAHEIPMDRDAIAKWEVRVRDDYGDGDLRQIREFSAKTLFAIGDLLKS